jgi:hypothetical protein
VTFDPADYAGLDADPWELQQLEEVLGEVGAEGYEDPGGGDPDEDEDGPWHDRLMEQAGAALGDSAARDAQRLAEDVSDSLALRPSAEVKAARALQRIEAGTYTRPATLRPARDSEGLFSVSCGEAVDDFGRCASRFHQPDCHVIMESAAATGSYEEAEAWNATLNGQPSAVDVAGAQAQLGLAGGQPGADGLDMRWADTLGDDRELPYEQLRDQLFHRMALADAPARQRQPDSPDTTAIRAALGI